MLWNSAEHEHNALRSLLIWRTSSRIPYSFSALPSVLIAAISFLVLAYLSRRQQTYQLRLLLLPLVVVSLVSWPCKYTWVLSSAHPELAIFDWANFLLVGALVAKVLEFSLTPEGMLKTGEQCLPAIGDSQFIQRQHLRYVPQGVYDAFEVAVSLRGVGFRFGAGTYLPPHRRPLLRRSFLYTTFLSLLGNLAAIDIAENILQAFPGVLTPGGGSIFYTSLPPSTRYFVSTLLCTLTGWHMFSGFMMIYDLAMLFCVGILHVSPDSWPPALEDPFHADSLHKFWARSWHQLLRRTFIVYGGLPGRWMAGKLGMVIGTFLGSALFHEVSVYLVGKPWDWRPVVFFVLQSALLMCEKLWSRLTGKHVEGWPGRLWGYMCILIPGQFMIDSWYQRGLRGGLVIMIPSQISPTARLLHYLGVL
jgi:hypothetical protein